LGDAEASLRISDHRRYRSERAIIELHRAEARLRAAEAVDVSESRSFTTMCRSFEEIKVTVGSQPQHESRFEYFRDHEGNVAPEVHTALRQAKSLIVDGMRFLDRAAPVLLERRRNVWWTSWFFERRMRGIAMSVWAAVFETGTPIPFLGFEAAAAGTQTIADSLLEDAIRMISVDAYRLATIVDAYASCIKALQIRMWLDASSRHLLGSRKSRMQDRLKNALVEVQKALQRRHRPDFGEGEKPLDGRDEIDPDALCYINKVVKREGFVDDPAGL
ncbi:MAG TPA: hypothetical protein VIK39_05450, partial [Candidatus Angelobacter sp.]